MDRNPHLVTLTASLPLSPPARVAWIETSDSPSSGCSLRVATREGGVDRNTSFRFLKSSSSVSPPARVAWIETSIPAPRSPQSWVATREGGVDRNAVALIWAAWVVAVATREGGVDRNWLPPKFCLGVSRRHPRGWRG